MVGGRAAARGPRGSFIPLVKLRVAEDKVLVPKLEPVPKFLAFDTKLYSNAVPKAVAGAGPEPWEPG